MRSARHIALAQHRIPKGYLFLIAQPYKETDRITQRIQRLRLKVKSDVQASRNESAGVRSRCGDKSGMAVPLRNGKRKLNCELARKTSRVRRSRHSTMTPADRLRFSVAGTNSSTNGDGNSGYLQRRLSCAMPALLLTLSQTRERNQLAMLSEPPSSTRRPASRSEWEGRDGPRDSLSANLRDRSRRRGGWVQTLRLSPGPGRFHAKFVRQFLGCCRRVQHARYYLRQAVQMDSGFNSPANRSTNCKRLREPCSSASTRRKSKLYRSAIISSTSRHSSATIVYRKRRWLARHKPSVRCRRFRQ